MGDAYTRWAAIKQGLGPALSVLMSNCPLAHREDVLAQTRDSYVRAVERGTAIRDHKHYAGGILQNKVKDHFRRSLDHRELQLRPTIADVEGNHEAAISLVETELDIEVALEQLKVADPNAFRALMSRIATRSLREIAATEDIAISTAHERVERGRNFLRRECCVPPDD